MNDDLKGLQSETKPYVQHHRQRLPTCILIWAHSTMPKNGEDSRTMVLYQEQDVERRAWERHGGKLQFINQ